MENEIKEYFEINNDENRQHINLSNYAMNIIELDMINFEDDYDLTNRSGFINKVISNYYDSFPLSRNKVLKQIKAIEEATKGDKISTTIAKTIIDVYSYEFMKNTISEHKDKYSNEISFKLKINKYNIELLESVEEAKYFNEFANRKAGLSLYIKLILETYALLSTNEREKVYFKETIEVIENAINTKTYIKYKFNNENQKKVPIDIGIPKGKQRLSVRVVNLIDEEFNISSITVKELSKSNLRATKEKNRDKIVFDLMNKDNKGMIEFFSEDSYKTNRKDIECVVKFTDSGLRRYLFEIENIKIMGRPHEEDEHTYTFKANEIEIYKNLFIFGHQMEIISPLNIKNNFKKLYEAASKSYSEKQ